MKEAGGRLQTARHDPLTQGIGSSLEALMLHVLLAHDRTHAHSPAVGVRHTTRCPPHRHAGRLHSPTQALATHQSLLLFWGVGSKCQVPKRHSKRNSSDSTKSNKMISYETHWGQVLRGTDRRNQEQKEPCHTKAHWFSETSWIRLASSQECQGLSPRAPYRRQHPNYSPEKPGWDKCNLLVLNISAFRKLYMLTNCLNLSI